MPRALIELSFKNAIRIASCWIAVHITKNTLLEDMTVSSIRLSSFDVRAALWIRQLLR